ncbi:azoreductase, partial [Mycoplasmopsis synoviae]
MAKVLVLSGGLSEKEKSYSSQMLDLFVKTYKKVHPNDELEFVDLNTTKHAEVFLSRNTFATYW